MKQPGHYSPQANTSIQDTKPYTAKEERMACGQKIPGQPGPLRKGYDSGVKKRTAADSIYELRGSGAIFG
jgi:hypothetical protein